MGLSFNMAAGCPASWFDDEHLGIDQGPILLMAENHRSELIWKVMKRSPYIRRGLRQPVSLVDGLKMCKSQPFDPQGYWKHPKSLSGTLIM